MQGFLKKSVWLFTEGKAKDNALLGNKGANLHEMTALDLPVPFGLIFTTRTCIEYNRLGEKLPDGIITQVMQVITKIEIHQGKKFGVPQNQLLVPVCSGAAVSMPGMMDTILNLGLNDKIYQGPIRIESRTTIYNLPVIYETRTTYFSTIPPSKKGIKIHSSWALTCQRNRFWIAYLNKCVKSKKVNS